MSKAMEHVEIQGSGLPIVFLHCSLSSKAQWEDLCHTLSGYYQTIAIDLLGYGANPILKPRNNFTLTEEIEHVSTTLEQVLGKNYGAHIVGHSYGGAVALKFAQRHPQKVLSLTLYEPVSFHLLESPHEALSTAKRIYSLCLQLIRNRRPKLAAEVFVDFWNGKGTFKRLNATIQHKYSTRITKVLMDFLAIFKDPLALDEIKHLPFVTHLIYGKQTQSSTQAIIEKLNANLVYKTLHSIDAGHLGPITHAPIFNQLVYRFFELDVEQVIQMNLAKSQAL